MSTDYTTYKELEKPIVFIGNPRSGTSVISEIVMRHKDIGFASKFQDKNAQNLKINYLRRILDNRFWRIQGQKKQLNNLGILNKFTFRTFENYNMWQEILGSDVDFRGEFLLNETADPETIYKVREYFQKIVSYQGRKRLAFKITGPSRLGYIHSIFPDAHFVRIHRKAVPTISSLLKSGFWETRGQKQLWWKGVYSVEEKKWAEAHKNDPVAMTAFQIKKVTDVTDFEIAKTRADVFDVQYGDFIQNPEGIIQGILDYTGLAHDKGCFSYFKKNKIYNRNKKDEEYFEAKDLETIRSIYSKENQYLASHS